MSGESVEESEWGRVGVSGAVRGGRGESER